MLTPNNANQLRRELERYTAWGWAVVTAQIRNLVMQCP